MVRAWLLLEISPVGCLARWIRGGGLWAYGAFPRLTWPGLGLLGVAAFVKKGAALILSKLASIPARARAPGPCQ